MFHALPKHGGFVGKDNESFVAAKVIRISNDDTRYWQIANPPELGEINACRAATMKIKRFPSGMS